MILANRIWLKQPGASSEALQKLREAAGVELPDQYFDLLAFSNGGEGPLPVPPYNFCLDSAEDAARLKREKTYDESFPGFFVIGGNGSGEYIAFDHRGPEPRPVVALDMTNIDLDESAQLVAPDFPAFLALVGLEEPEAQAGDATDV